MVPFQYVEFYDVPRMIFLPYRSGHFLLQSPFDEGNDEYSEGYAVYKLSELDLAAFKTHGWKFVETAELKSLGIIACRSVRFDPTKRKELDASILEKFLEGIAAS